MKWLISILLITVASASNPHDYVCSNVDAVFMVDSSQSITKQNFVKITKYMQQFVNLYNIGTGSTQAQFGGVVFNDGVRLSWPLSQYRTKQQLIVNLEQLPYTVGTTNLEKAFERVKSILQGPDARSGSCKAVILFTDGWADQGSQQQRWANIIRNDLKATIISIAVEGINGFLDPFNQPALEQLSGNSKYVFHLNQLTP